MVDARPRSKSPATKGEWLVTPGNGGGPARLTDPEAPRRSWRRGGLSRLLPGRRSRRLASKLALTKQRVQAQQVEIAKMRSHIEGLEAKLAEAPQKRSS